MKRIGMFVGGASRAVRRSALAGDFIIIATDTPTRTFDPPTLQINVGDTVTFMNDPATPGFHNVRSDTDSVTAVPLRQRVRRRRRQRQSQRHDVDGDGDVSDRRLRVGFYCEIHGGDDGVGMSGVITVGGCPVGVGARSEPGSLAGTAERARRRRCRSRSATPAMPISPGPPTRRSPTAPRPNVPWLSIAPNNGTVVVGDPPTSVNVTLDATALTPGVYNANVCVHSNDAANDPVSVPVAFTVDVSGADQIFANGFDP